MAKILGLEGNVKKLDSKRCRFINFRPKLRC